MNMMLRPALHAARRSSRPTRVCAENRPVWPVQFDEDMRRWTDDFLEVVKDVPSATDPAQSASVLRKLVKSELLKFTDMRDQPEKFFMAHRHLSTIGLGGFGIRFTVQFNLFAGSIVGLASEEQLAVLDNIQKTGKLGCFLLTEMQAGVLSGLIVETTCTWDPDAQEFVLNTPSDKAAKNWISQGFVAECGSYCRFASRWKELWAPSILS